MAAHGFDAKSRFFALSWSSTDRYGFNCPSMLPVFQGAEASRRTSPLSKSCGCVVSAIVSSISHPGAISFKESINASTTYSVWPLVEANTMCRRNPHLVKFGTRPPGLSIRYPSDSRAAHRDSCPHFGELAPKLTYDGQRQGHRRAIGKPALLSIGLRLKRDQTRTSGASNSIQFTSCEAPNSNVKLPHAVSKG